MNVQGSNPTVISSPHAKTLVARTRASATRGTLETVLNATTTQVSAWL